MRKKKIILSMAIIASLVSGCGVKIVSSSDVVGGKVDQRWGVVELVRAAGLNKGREEKARELMAEYCAPQNYQVQNSANTSGLSAIVGNTIGDVTTATAIPVNKLQWQFVCLDQ